MSFVLLMIAFLLTGVISIANKTLVQMNLGDFRDAYMLTYFGAPALLGLVYLVAKRDHGNNTDRRVGLIMGLGGALSTLCFLIALQYMKGIVAFPVRSLGNLVVTAMVSIAAWRERLSISQWIGIALSLIAIWLIY
jgi:drug/metabolite transporter (DMT)-like permease